MIIIIFIYFFDFLPRLVFFLLFLCPLSQCPLLLVFSLFILQIVFLLEVFFLFFLCLFLLLATTPFLQLLLLLHPQPSISPSSGVSELEEDAKLLFCCLCCIRLWTSVRCGTTLPRVKSLSMSLLLQLLLDPPFCCL